MSAALLRRMHGRKHACGRPFGDAPHLPDCGDTLRLLPLAESPTLAVPRIPSTATISSAPTLPACAEGDDTIATPLELADTLPCPRLAADDAPTLRASPRELAALLRLMRPPGSPPPLPAAVPLHPSDSSVRVPESGRTWQQPRRPPQTGAAAQSARPEHLLPLPARPPYRPQPNPAVAAQGRCEVPPPAAERDAMMPTQLWFGPPAGAVRWPARPTRPGSFWVRLWRRLGLGAKAVPRRKVLPRSQERGRSK